MIKAIDTVYNGYKFRSRLEARWAVFFDSLGIKYEYEQEGFDLGENAKLMFGNSIYLPDFFLPEMDVFVEVKPEIDTMSQKEWEEFSKPMLISLAKLHGLGMQKNKDAIALFGTPGQENIHLYGPKNSDGNPFTYLKWAECRHCENAYWLFNSSDLAGIRIGSNHTHKKCGERYPLADTGKLKKAYQKSRQARFEHGETPKP